jgi:CubicO group peptidase (beta-lactamase class C family)
MACTAGERAQLDAAAERAGMSVSAFMRRQCLGTAGPRAARRPPVERAALAQILAQLGKCGSNLNQIARALNSGVDVQLDIAAAVAEFRQVAADITRTLGRGDR